MLSRSSGRSSAVWTIQGMEGVLLGRLQGDPLGRHTEGWTWANLNEQYQPIFKKLQGEKFHTRKEALQALEIVLILEEAGD